MYIVTFKRLNVLHGKSRFNGHGAYELCNFDEAYQFDNTYIIIVIPIITPYKYLHFRLQFGSRTFNIYEVCMCMDTRPNIEEILSW